MFDIPENGWVNVKIGRFKNIASYLTSIHKDSLTACIASLEKYIPLIIKFDAEGFEYTLFSDGCESIVVVEEDEKLKFFHYNISKNVLIREIYEDISENIEAWSMWEFEKENWSNDAIVLKELIVVLNKLIDEKLTQH